MLGAAGPGGETQLATAVTNGAELAELRSLLEGKANANQRIALYDDGTALHAAINACPRISTVRVLVEEGKADVNVKDRDGWTPLMFACKKQSSRLVEYLLGKGADWRAPNKDGKTAKDIASGNKGLLKLFGDGGSENHQDKKRKEVSVDRVGNKESAAGVGGKKESSSDDREIVALREENAKLRAKLRRFESLDILVVWNGEDGGPSVRAAAPSDLREQTQKALDLIWDYEYPRDSRYNKTRTKAYAAGERRPMACLYRVKPQMTPEEVEAGEPDTDKNFERFQPPM